MRNFLALLLFVITISCNTKENQLGKEYRKVTDSSMYYTTQLGNYQELLRTTPGKIIDYNYYRRLDSLHNQYRHLSDSLYNELQKLKEKN